MRKAEPSGVELPAKPQAGSHFARNGALRVL
jgi:hypothetical protein